MADLHILKVGNDHALGLGIGKLCEGPENLYKNWHIEVYKGVD